MLLSLLCVALPAQEASVPPAEVFAAHAAADRWLVAGEFERARAEFERALTLDPERPALVYGLACAAAGAGQGLRALGLLERAAELGYADAAVARWDADLASLRGEPRFDGALQSMRAGRPALVSPELREFAVHEDSALELGLARLAPDGSLVARPLRGADAGTLRLIATDSGAHVLDVVGPGAVLDCAFAPDGETLASVHAGGALRLWSLSDGALRASAAIEALEFAWTDKGASVAYVAGGERLLTACNQGGILWASDGAPIAHWPGSVLHASCVDGDVLASKVEGGVALWDVVTGERLGETLPFNEEVRGLALSPDGELLGVGRRDGRFSVVEVATRRVLWSERMTDLFGEELRIPTVRFAPDGTRVAVCTVVGFHVHVFEARTGTQLYFSDHLGGRMGGHMPLEYGATWLYGDAGYYRFDVDGNVKRQQRTGLRTLQVLAGDPDLTVFALERGATAFVDEFEGRELYRRVELLDGKHLLHAPSGYFTSDLFELSSISLVHQPPPERKVRWVKLAGNAARLFDPKRVRAAQAGIALVVPELE